MPLTQKFTMHARVQGGAIYGYDILDGETVVGSKMVTINKRTRPWTETAVYLLDGCEFSSSWAFRHAYECGRS